MTAGLVLLLIGVALVFIVTAQNARSVRFDFLWVTGELPLAVLLLAAVLVTLIVDEAVGLVWRRRRRHLRSLARDRAGIDHRSTI